LPDEFIDMYEKMYLMAITKLLKKKIMQNSIIVFCMDAPRESLWRMQIDSNYKATRTDMNLKYNIKPIFKHTYKTIIPNILKENKNMFSILTPNCEADDVIACITLSLKIKPKQNIIIVSGDNDFLQLGRVNVKFINYRQKLLIEIDEKQAELFLHEKILLGDKSDNINSIFPPRIKNINKKELLVNISKFNEYIKNNMTMQTAYEHNKMLIDFTCIPQKYYDNITSIFNDKMKSF